MGLFFDFVFQPPGAARLIGRPEMIDLILRTDPKPLRTCTLQGFARFDSRGELRLAGRLKNFLEENASRVAQILAKHDVPIDMAKDNRNRISVKRVAVRFLSMHTAKGWSFLASPLPTWVR